MSKKIMLDAGHALNTAGNKTLDGIYEWTLNNNVAVKVANLLKGYEVEVIRVDDETGKKDLPLTERVAKINKMLPDVLVSIHHNAYNNKWGNHTGIEAYYNINRKKDVEKKLATDIGKRMCDNTKLYNRGCKYAAFTMLTCDLKVDAILTEGGFMDSVIDHPVITSVKGQEAYAKAIADGLISHLNLKKKSVQPEAPREAETPLKIGNKYTLAKSTIGYYTAADALNKKDGRVTVTVGDYYIFALASGMINITKTKGYPGSWINPNNIITTTPPPTTTTTQTPKIGEKYTLKVNIPGYYTAADAKNQKDVRVTVQSGEYFVYSISSGMVNVTKVKGKPGSWINPSSNVTSTTPVNNLTIGQSYTLAKSTAGYYTSTDAQSKKNAVSTLSSGNYYIFNLANGMINLTKTKGKAGTWINPT